MDTPKFDAAGQQLRNLHIAVESDPTIPVAHKSILNKILSLLLQILPSILEIFVGDDGDVASAVIDPGVTSESLLSSTGPHQALAASPVGASLAKAVASASAQSGQTDQGKGILDKIFAFILKILPTVLGLFSSSPVSAAAAPPPQQSGAGGAAVNSSGSGSQAGGGSPGGGNPPSVDAGASAAAQQN